MKALVLGALTLAALACSQSAANHEQLGDRSYAAAAYRDALAEYELALKARPTADLHAKAGAAALHTQDLMLAVAQYRALGERDNSRVAEAAEGLERVIRAAVAANDRAALTSGLAAVRAVAPTRPLGRYARLVALEAAESGDTVVAMALLPVAVAAATDARSGDSLLYAYGLAAARARDCQTAVAAFEGVLRRQREPVVVEGAREGLSLCALMQGQALLERGQPAEAESWFRRATAPGASTEVERAAFLGLGDVRLAQGDVPGALDGYQQAIAGGIPGDSITVRAQQKINALGKADGADAPAPKQL
ncbi:MAG TPA: tetratricopeptide repeat protein [Gemmatimonadales bacterium]|nr:tetratricopeptide repeat protein [Gemmatimonadales bacterium]